MRHLYQILQSQQQNLKNASVKTVQKKKKKGGLKSLKPKGLKKKIREIIIAKSKS